MSQPLACAIQHANDRLHRYHCPNHPTATIPVYQEHLAELVFRAGIHDDLLAALKRILPYCMPPRDDEPTPLYEHYHASKAVREAIAKAEGKS